MADLGVVVTIRGVDVSSHVVSLKRQSDLCNPGQTCQIELNAAFDAAAYDPWDELTISEVAEFGATLVLTGYVEKVSRRRSADMFEVTGRDTFKRAVDWYIDDQELIANGETVAYWIDYLCNLCGLAYSIVPTEGLDSPVGYDFPMGMRTVAEALNQVIAFVGWQMRVAPDGTLEFLDLDAETDAIRNLVAAHGMVMDAACIAYFGSLPNAIPTDPTRMRWWELHLRTERGERISADTTTRTVIKVWGYNPVEGSELLYQEFRPVEGSVPEQRIGVFAHPGIDSLEEAQGLATAALDQFAYLEQQGDLVVLGDPRYRVGDLFRVTAFNDMGYVTLNEVCTNLESKIDLSGYSMSLFLGGRCPHLPDYPLLNEVPLVNCGESDLAEQWTRFIEHEPVPSASPDVFDFAKRIVVTGERIIVSGNPRLLREYTNRFLYEVPGSCTPVESNWPSLIQNVDSSERNTHCLRASDGALLWTAREYCPASWRRIQGIGIVFSLVGEQFYCFDMQTDGTKLFTLGLHSTVYVHCLEDDLGNVIEREWRDRVNLVLEARSLIGGGVLWSVEIDTIHDAAAAMDREVGVGQRVVDAMSVGEIRNALWFLRQDTNNLYLIGIVGGQLLSEKTLAIQRRSKFGGSLLSEFSDTSVSRPAIRAAATFGTSLYLCASGFLEKRNLASGALIWAENVTETPVALAADATGVYYASNNNIEHRDHDGNLVWATGSIPFAPRLSDPFAGGALLWRSPITSASFTQGNMAVWGDCLYITAIGSPSNTTNIQKRSKYDGTLEDEILDAGDIRHLCPYKSHLYLAGGVDNYTIWKRNL